MQEIIQNTLLFVTFLAFTSLLGKLLKNTGKAAPIDCVIHVSLISDEHDEYGLPNATADLHRHANTPITPNVGMEIDDWNILGAKINRVLIGQDGFTIYAELKLPEEDFDIQLQMMENDDWHTSTH